MVCVVPRVAGLPFVDTFTPDSSPGFPGTINSLSAAVYTMGGPVLSPDNGVGIDWNSMQSFNNVAFTLRKTTSGFTDGIACFQSALINIVKHYVKITHFVDAGYNYTAPADSHEIEQFVFFQVTANNARGYEQDIVGGSLSPVRWNGAVGSFDVFGTTWGTTISGAAPTGLGNGDVTEARASVVGGNAHVDILVNGSLVFAYEDQSAGKITTGYPAIGSFIRSGVADADMWRYAIRRAEFGNW